MPTDIFYNTGISTYVWLLNNRKPSARRGKVQLIDASSERFWKSMRKSLGSKRREIPEAARHEVVRIYAEMLNGSADYSKFSKIFDTTAFGYREIRIERPLRLNFQATAQRVARLAEGKAVQRLEVGEEQELLDALAHHLPTQSFTNRDAFDKALAKALKGAGARIGAPVKKAILSALSERDETADLCLDTDGKPEPDTELRDHELVPLNEGWRDYVARELKLRPCDVVITKDSETPGDIAIPAFVDETAAGVVCGYHLAILRAHAAVMRGDFLFWCLQSRPVKEAFSTRAQGITRFGLTLDGIGAVPVPMPDLKTKKATRGTDRHPRFNPRPEFPPAAAAGRE